MVEQRPQTLGKLLLERAAVAAAQFGSPTPSAAKVNRAAAGHAKRR
jgi:hypothetical protein